MPGPDPPAQLDLFPTAPCIADTGGRGVSGRGIRIASFLDMAVSKGCTHVEVSTDGILLVTPALVGREPTARYLPLSDIKVRNALTASGDARILRRKLCA